MSRQPTETSGAVAEGPSAAAVWKDVATDTGRHLEIAGLAEGTSYTLPAAHRIRRDRDGRPQLSLTLVLSAVPAGGQDDLEPLIVAGTAAFTVGWEALPAPTPARQPLFVRSTSTTLVGSDEAVLASSVGSGELAAALTATLSRDTALAFWAAMRGQDAGLRLVTEVGYRAVTGPVQATIRGSWADLWELAAGPGFARTYGNRPVTEQLAVLLQQAISTGAVTAQPAGLDPATVAAAIEPVFRAAARAMLYDGERLGPRPGPWATLELAAVIAGAGVDQTVTVSTPLADVLADTGDPGRFVTAVAIDAQGRTVVPRRSVQRAGRDAPAPTATPRLVAQPSGRIRSTGSLLAISRPGTAMLSEQLSRVGLPAYTVGVHAAALDAVTDAMPETADLPVLGDPAGWVFDRRDRPGRFYAPSFDLQRPLPTDTADVSPFVFGFARSGATASGEPGLDGDVLFTLHPVLGPDAAAALAGQDGSPIPAEQLQVTLDIPFRDAAGATQRQRLAADVSFDGSTLTARVGLLDTWVRLAYGALSQPGFQAEPARLQISWTFAAWQQIEVDRFVVWGNKFAHIPIINRQLSRDVPVERRQPDLWFDAASGTVVTPVGRLTVTAAPDTRGSAVLPVRPALRAERLPLDRVLNRAGLRPVDDDSIPRPIPRPFPRPLPWPRPDPEPEPDPGPRFRWVSTTVARTEVIDVLLPCTEFGACYVERRPEGPVPVGCLDALRLGQADWRQYEPIGALDDPAYRVYRSLQQPGRFLVQPTRYCLSRFAADEPRAYDPMLLLYSLIDPADPAANRVVLEATLQPAIEPPQWLDLQDRLRTYAAAPVIDLLTDVEGSSSFSWTLPLPSATITTVPIAGGVAVSIGATLADALLLRSILEQTGLTGSLSCKLPDGTTLSSTLRLGLREIAGPVHRGPIQVTVTGAQATLTNRIERPVAVSALRVDPGSGGYDLTVETELAPAQSCTVDLARADGSAPPTADRCWPDYTVGSADAADLTEIRSYVEDITMNVIFLDLIAHDQHRLVRLDVAAQLIGLSPEQPVIMSGSPPSGETSFVLPLTSYSAGRVVGYRATAVLDDGSVVVGPALTWDVGELGAVIGLTWAAVQPT